MSAMTEKRYETDRHHLFWTRKVWTKREWAKKLRTHPYCIYELPVSQHRMLHDAILEVDLPNEEICKRAYDVVDLMWHSGHIGPEDCFGKRVVVLTSLLSEANATCTALRAQQMFAC